MSSKFNESLRRLSSDYWITYSPYDIKNMLINKPKEYRILYDANTDLYMICDAEKYIHYEMLEMAYERGYYSEWEDYIDSLGSLDNYVEFGMGGQFDENDNEVDAYLTYLIFNPDSPPISEIGDGYFGKCEYPFGSIYTREGDYLSTELYKILDKTRTNMTEDYAPTDVITWIKNNCVIENDEPWDTTPLYILPDGTFLNIKATIKEKFATHMMFEQFLVDNEVIPRGSDDSFYLTEHCSCIRCNHNLSYGGAGVIELPKTINSASYSALTDFIDTESKVVHIVTYDGKQHRVYYKSDTTTDDIIKNIKRYYSSGTLYEHIMREGNRMSDKNELKDRAKHHSKHQNGLSPFCSLGESALTESGGLRLNGFTEDESMYFEDGNYCYHFLTKGGWSPSAEHKYAVLVVDYGIRYGDAYTDEKSGQRVIPVNTELDEPKVINYFEFTENTYPDIIDAMLDDDKERFMKAVISASNNGSSGTNECLTEDTTQSLDKRAMQAYKDDDTYFFEDLPTKDLIKLWELCQYTDTNPFGRAYDDEVFDELANRGYDFDTGTIGGSTDEERFDRVKKATNNFTLSEGEVVCTTSEDANEVCAVLFDNGYSRTSVGIRDRKFYVVEFLKESNLKIGEGYGGAFDIADDDYFTRDDVNDAAEEVLGHIQETFSGQFDIGGCWFENGEFIVNIQDTNFGEYEASAKVDMRRIRKPSDLKKYALAVASNIIEQIKEGGDYTNEGLTEDVDFNFTKETMYNVEKFLYDNPDTRHLVGELDILNSSTFGILIENGDWKHEHLYLDTVVMDYLKSIGVEATKVVKQTGFSDSDCYSAWHYFVIKSAGNAPTIDSTNTVDLPLVEGIYGYQTIISNNPGEKQPTKTLLYGGNFVMSRSPYRREQIGADWKRHIGKIIEWSHSNNPSLFRMTHDFRLNNFADPNSEEAFIGAIEDMIKKGEYTLLTESFPIPMNENSNKRKKKKPFDSINKNAGNVEYNISMFNKANSPVDGPCNNPISGPMGGNVGCCESLTEEVNSEVDTDTVVKAIVDKIDDTSTDDGKAEILKQLLEYIPESDAGVLLDKLKSSIKDRGLTDEDKEILKRKTDIDPKIIDGADTLLTLIDYLLKGTGALIVVIGTAIDIFQALPIGEFIPVYQLVDIFVSYIPEAVIISALVDIGIELVRYGINLATDAAVDVANTLPDKEVKTESVSNTRVLPEKGNLVSALRTFDRNGKISARGSWKVANGGYDLAFEVYYNNTPVAQGYTDGTIKTDFDTNEFGFSKEQLRKVICSIFTDVSYDDDFDMFMRGV